MTSRSKRHQFSKVGDGRGKGLKNPERIGVKAGGWDDALHIQNPLDASRTLCQQDAQSRNLATYGELCADPGNACWTCRREFA